ncbi:MAG: hypothetical protein ACREOA_09345 [Candidatus Dormibacteria bacterium]
MLRPARGLLEGRPQQDGPPRVTWLRDPDAAAAELREKAAKPS